MRIKCLRVKNYRKLRGLYCVEGLNPGLNVIGGPNESGKSTLIQSLRTAFFEKYVLSDAALQTLSPYRLHADTTIEVDFEHDGQPYALSRVFGLKTSQTRLTSNRDTWENEHADQRLQTIFLFNPPKKRTALKPLGYAGQIGIWDTLWIKQGVIVHDPDALAQDTLRQALQKQIHQTAIHPQEREVKEKVKLLYHRYFTPQTKEWKKTYSEKFKERETMEAELDDLRRETEGLKELKRQAPVVSEEKERLSRQKQDSFESLERVTQAYREKRLLLDSALKAVESQRLLTKHQTSYQRFQHQRDSLTRDLASERAALETLSSTVKERIQTLEEWIQDIEERKNLLRMTSERWNQLAKAHKAFVQSESGIVHLTIDTVDDLPVYWNGQPCSPGAYTLTRSTTLTLGTYGALTITPDQDRLVERLRQEYQTLLDENGCSTLEEAEREFQTFIRYEDQLSGLREERNRPEDEYRAVSVKLVALEWIEAWLGAIDPLDADKEKRARTKLQVLMDTQKYGYLGRWSEVFDAYQAYRELDRTLDQVRQERNDVDPQAQKILSQETETLRAQMKESQETYARVAAEHKRVEQEHAELVGRLSVLESQNQRREKDIQTLSEKLERHDKDIETLKRRGGGIYQLYHAMEETEKTIKRELSAPLQEKSVAYLKTLFPTVDPRGIFFTEETFNPVQIERDGQEETIDALSLGTIEQIGVITRIAYGEILDGAYPLILDDPFVYSDRDRFERMVEILDRASRKVQIVVLTCHTERYRSLGVPLIELRRDDG